MAERGGTFICAICERPQGDAWAKFNACRDNHLPPLCRGCEHYYGRRSRYWTTDGSFKDRRVAAQIEALSEALITVAANIEWGAKYHGKA